jgi:histidinol-phosphate/aromatic aminotransferase/cobyric acid decarboxylase-like protein
LAVAPTRYATNFTLTPEFLESAKTGFLLTKLIDLLMRVILDPNDIIINTPPTFGMYAFDCAVNGRVQAKRNFQYVLTRLLEK